MAVAGTARWAWIWPVLAWTILLITPLLGGGGFVYAAAGVALFGTVFAAVYHAEMVAHRVGEPFGTLILALAVTVIETALIVSVMIAAPAEKAGLARDTVFAAVMIVCNGIVGACLLWGGVRHHEQGFQAQGASAALAVLVALTSLTMVLPNLAAQELGPLYNKPQLIFAGLVSLVLYFAFVFIQTVRHRDYFLPIKSPNPEEHLPPPDNRSTALSAVLLVVSLVAIVGLAKVLTPTVERGIDYLEVPKAVVGIIIAGLVLLPEAVAAIKAAQSDRLQTSLNLALGSALATIGLTIPAVAAVFDRAWIPSRTRAGRQRAGTAGADATSRRDHSGHRPDDDASGYRAFGHLCRVSVFCGGAVSHRFDNAARMSAFRTALRRHGGSRQ